MTNKTFKRFKKFLTKSRNEKRSDYFERLITILENGNNQY